MSCGTIQQKIIGSLVVFGLSRLLRVVLGVRAGRELFSCFRTDTNDDDHDR